MNDQTQATTPAEPTCKSCQDRLARYAMKVNPWGGEVAWVRTNFRPTHCRTCMREATASRAGEHDPR